MARQQVITYTDDLTGKTMEGTSAQRIYVVVGRDTFGLDVSGETYRKVIEPMCEAGEKMPRGWTLGAGPAVSQPTLPGTSAGTVADKEQRRAMRSWWNANAGRGNVPPFNDRGRIPTDVQALYQDYKGAPIPVTATNPAAKGEAKDHAETKAAKARVKSAMAKPTTDPFKADDAGGVTVARQRRPAKAGVAAPGRSPRRQGTRTA